MLQYSEWNGYIFRIRNKILFGMKPDPAASVVLDQNLMLHEVVTCCVRDTLLPRDYDGSSRGEAACYCLHMFFGSDEHCLWMDTLLFGKEVIAEYFILVSLVGVRTEKLQS